MNVSTLTAIAAQVDQNTFVSRFPHPVLLVKKGPGAAETALPAQNELAWRVTTQVGKSKPILPGFGTPATTFTSAAPLVKTTRNPFAGMVTLGRAANNDVCLYSGSVSKVHAYFHKDGERWLVRDGSSANGTFVNGVRVEASAPVPLEDGTVLAFGPDVECVFKLPGPLHGLLLHLTNPKAR